MVDDRAPLTSKADAGGVLWTLSAPSAGLGRPVVVGGTVYVPVSGGRIAAVDSPVPGGTVAGRPTQWMP
ncbi:hypothetical protein [Streptomyces sp. NPDC054834]